MIEIKLTQGKVALVDEDDYEWLTQWKWSAHFNQFGWYAIRTEKRKCIKMHRFIMGVTDPNIKIDHKDRNGLNNQRENLRKATDSQNLCNKIKKPNTTSKYKGVHWDKFNNKWRVQVQINDGIKRVGRFDNEIEAALAYNKAAIELQGEFARINVL